MDTERGAVTQAVRAGDEAAFAELVEPHRRELQVHCYRMLGSFEDAEDLVQETFLRAWRARESFEGRASVRAWLYRITTNACIDAAQYRQRRVLPSHLRPPSDATVSMPPRTDLPWLQPYPDSLLEPVAPSAAEPAAAAVTRETIEIAFLAAVQHLPARQRAVLVLHDALGWSAKDVASLLDMTVAAVNSAAQRARVTLRTHLPEDRSSWGSAKAPTAEEQEVLRSFMAAFERSDVRAVAELLREDAVATMPPYPMWHDGRATIVAALSVSFDPTSPWFAGEWRMTPVAANRQPAYAAYLKKPGDTAYRAFALDLLRMESGKVVEMTSFGDAALFAAFGLPETLSPAP